MAAFLCAVLAFVFESVIVQSHVHPKNPVFPSYMVFASLAERQTLPVPIATRDNAEKAAPFAVKAAPDGDPPLCPLCWDLANSGHFDSPVAASLAMPSPRSLAVLFPAASGYALVASHNWRERAPPPL
jgi:hypothetical protein